MHVKKRWFFLLFCENFEQLDDVIGGAQVRPFELSTNLARLGHRVHICTLSGNKILEQSYFEGNLTVRPIRCRSGTKSTIRRYFAVRKAIAEEAKRAHAEGFHKLCYYQQVPAGVLFRFGIVPVLTSPAVLLFDWARKQGFSIWASVHDLSPLHELSVIKRTGQKGRFRYLRLKGLLQTWQQKLLLPKADFVTTVSNPLLEVLAESYKIPPNRLCLFPSGCNPDLIESVTPWEPPCSEDSWSIGYLGSPHDVSLELLIDSVAALGRENVKLVLAGKNTTEMLSNLENRWPHLEVIEDVRYANYSKIANRIDLWVIVFNDEYCIDYSWQLKNPMALASGRPVVRTGGAGMEASGLSECFYLTGTCSKEIAQTIAEVIDNPKVAQQRAIKGREIILKQHSWRSIVEHLVDRLNDLTSGDLPNLIK